MNWTKEEIENSKKIAELGVIKKVCYGDWYKTINGTFLCVVFELAHSKYIIPLWTWQDCREWLWKRKWRVVQHYDGYGINRKEKSPDVVAIKLWNWESELLPELKATGKTDTETIQNAMIKVLEENKND